MARPARLLSSSAVVALDGKRDIELVVIRVELVASRWTRRPGSDTTCEVTVREWLRPNGREDAKAPGTGCSWPRACEVLAPPTSATSATGTRMSFS
jgi:hypothetical protein